MNVTDAALDEACIRLIRGFAMDAPRAANSGHPGTAMALAPLAQVLFGRVMRYDPADPHWPDRDRFVLSAGHASILLYSSLFLHGYDLSLDDLKAFRQWGSRTPGHPEVHHTAGVEVTTGPLGQGFANAVGLAIAERITRTRFGTEVCDHQVFAIAGDGCLQEGISHEAAALAGHLGLGRLLCVYDDNHITIDGDTALSSHEDTALRFSAYGWNVVRLGEVADDTDLLERAIRAEMGRDDAPTLFILRSHIGHPSPKYTDSAKAHGDPFEPEEIALTKQILGLPSDVAFYAPTEVVEPSRARAQSQGSALHSAWRARLDSWTGDRGAYDAAQANRGIDGWADHLPSWSVGESVATRVAIQKCLDAVLDHLPGLVSGAADLTGNTGTRLTGELTQARDEPGGRQIHFGIREHAMAGALNGMAMHGGVLPVGGTFFVFSDYMRPAVRLAAMSGAKSLFVWTHDSVGLGEDGPTHQPIEQLAAFRAMPGLRLLRPADANEVAAALRIAVDGDGPTALVLSRQGTPVLDGTSATGVARGAYVLRDDPNARIILVGTGTEVAVCVAAASELAERSVRARVVSMPSWDLFEQQDEAYQQSVLSPGLPVLSVEAASTFGWSRWADASIGIDRYGASAPGAVAMDRLGINVEAVVDRAVALLG